METSHFCIPKSMCTGCAACVNICSRDAIQMEEGSGGFPYPAVDADKCTDCGRCFAVCASRGRGPEGSLEVPLVYAMRSRNEELRLHSTSGGIFSELAQWVLDRGGNVAGAVYRPDWSVGHCMIQDIGDLEGLRRSKYQQSHIGPVYREVRDALGSQKEVLFCGTPCQAGGLRAFLGKEYDNLYLCDFICRGVSSPKLFAAYIDDLKIRYGSDIRYVWMKNKRNGWHSLTTAVGFENGEEYVRKGMDDSYVQMYLKYNAGVRESCYDCRFKGENDVADITLGDFWGLEGTELDDNLGTSVVICRTGKGEKLVRAIQERVLWQEKRIEEVRRGNPCLYDSIGESAWDMDLFHGILEKEGFQQAFRRMAEESV